MFGFLNFHKPLQLTSHDCVAKVRRLLREKRVGHGGTLDPLAEGVLPMAVGQATRLLPYLPREKQYQAIIRFGIRTDSDDLAGQILENNIVQDLTLTDIERVLPTFLGNIEQIPPQYSAIQINGKRLYELARAGITQDVPSRIVEISNLQVLDWRSGDQPELDLQVTCGEGTYIRALARDLGDRLGVGATLAGLVRQQSGGLNLANSVTLGGLEELVAEGRNIPLLSPQQALNHLPTVQLDTELAKRWFHGQRLPLPDLPIGPVLITTELPPVKCLGVAIVTPEDHGTVLRPKVVFNGD
ncbi:MULTISPECIES: tRNA pseudouridine(55) synthase TruB [unclassified Synechocystis]|uniref:tRNA pseudouridine(55) synthase TruB n=1 Tax=unclassified Synechocystis TaxID=2640012 RepID=UPI0003FF3392|nr:MULTISPECIES: tRNA pseudouridine(55) synthase TruB [unclassified Synechocystis]AIE72931.1 tRNA pseudouridine synthase B [Synechocystis sp. PCC 6714]MCT0252592.1 tRNA pseudouridine(55) synthase TruB [Synechocystis sp. CS-94]